MQSTKASRGLRIAVAAASAFALAFAGATPAYAKTTLTVLTDNTETSIKQNKAIEAAFEKLNPTVNVKFNTRPGGGDGDNLVKTKLATNQMEDVFYYNTGSLLQALAPSKTLVDLTREPFQSTVQASFKQTVSSNGKVYGAPYGTAMGGGILYNKAVYKTLGLKVPKTWDAFMANNAKIKAAGKVAPVIQTYGDTWTSQLFVLADFYNVQQADPTFATKYTGNKIKYATSRPALKGFQYIENLKKLNYYNTDFASAKFNDGLRMLAMGEGAHYPMLTFAVDGIAVAYPDKLKDIGFFAMPGTNAAKNGLTVWTGSGMYIPAKSKNIDLAKKFIAFAVSKAGTDIVTKVQGQSGPYFTTTASAPAKNLPGAVKDIFKYFNEGKTAPALEFLSPIKGPNLENLLVSVGTGQLTAAAAAKLYDEDVVKQAKQLGLKGW